MARSPRTSSKQRTPAKARKGTSAKRGVAKKSAGSSKQRRTSKAAATKRRPRAGATGEQNWSSALTALVSSSLGREILADVLEAAAGALRRAQGNMQEAIAAGTSAASEASDTAVSVSSELVSGTAAVAQTATEVLGDVVTAAARSLLPDSANAARTDLADRSERNKDD